MSEEEMNKASQDYRNFREECGIKDPVVLDEIEEAFYAGMILMVNVAENERLRKE